MSIKLTPRLMTAVPYVRGGRLVADIGTDHAYLPIYLCEQRRLSPVTAKNGETLCAVAADINKGPVERADQHIAEARLTKYIKTLQTDGLTGLDAFDPADIIIFGMGGELITSILAAAPWAGGAGKRLILQPMTHAEKLREYLLKTGFAIIGETLSREGDRIYQTICAEPAPEGYTPPVLSPAELAVGQKSFRTGDPEQKNLYAALIDKT
ncbi:MAG: SAM-dependent methyltransferase, partial [Clostridia bacterium]|nr:SAM-dependent methyltransferase [Clostridia bacterium]